jgi:hypothetical protein
MSVLLDKLRSAARARAQDAEPGRLAQGSLLAQALQRAQSERDAARGAAEIVPADADTRAANEEVATAPTTAAEPLPSRASHGHGVVALLLAMAILVAAIAIWHSAPSNYDAAQHPPPSLKLDHSLKTK